MSHHESTSERLIAELGGLYRLCRDYQAALAGLEHDEQQARQQLAASEQVIGEWRERNRLRLPAMVESLGSVRVARPSAVVIGDRSRNSALAWLVELGERAQEWILSDEKYRDKLDGTTRWLVDELGIDRERLWAEVGAELSDSNSDLSRAIEAAIRRPAAHILATAGFRDRRHDGLLRRLQTVLEVKLLEHPQIDLLQGMQDRGCDLIVAWPARAKYGVQLKNDDDVKDKQFFIRTKAQITESRTHGLERLYIVLAADITGQSNREKVRQMQSEISALKDPYVVAISPECSWNLLFPAEPAENTIP
jgi:hypothetical protein